MRSLIMADFHEKWERVDKLLTAVPHDKAYCLGDAFDDYKSTPESLRKTAEYVKAHLNDITWLIGNHDLPYGWGHLNSRDFYCPGYSNSRGETVRRVLKKPHWERFRFHDWVDGWLLSHAGLHPHLFRNVPVEEIPTVVDYALGEAWKCLNAGRLHFLFGWGSDRGGDQQLIGGVNWLDWNSFQAIPGLNQIVGHTFDKTLRSKQTSESDNFCIDTAFRHFALIEDGCLEIYQTADFIKR